MEKEIRVFEVNYLLDWEYRVEISKLRADLDAIEALGATHVEIESSVMYDCVYVTIKPVSEHLETDEEFKARVDEVEKRQSEIKRRELEQLEKLKSKYGL